MTGIGTRLGLTKLGLDLDVYEAILATEFDSMVAGWALDETSGVTADNMEGTAARDGTYGGVTLNQDQTPFICPRFDGVNDYVDVHSASLSTAFPWKKGTLLVYTKAYSDNIWNDINWKWFVGFRDDQALGGNKSVYQIFKTNNAREIAWTCSFGGKSNSIQKSGISGTDWLCLAATWDDADGNNRFRAYYNGVQEGSDSAYDVTPDSTTLTDTWAAIGAMRDLPIYQWNGYIAPVVLWSTELTASQIARLASYIT